VDWLLKIPRFPESDEKLLAQFAGLQAGGLVANACCAAARMGLKSAWYGCVGDDQLSEMLMAAFHSFGVEVKYVNVIRNSTSDFTVILLQPGGQRTILIAPVLPHPPPLDRDVKKALATTRLAYTVPFEQGWFTEFSSAVHAGGGKTAIDLEGCVSQYQSDVWHVLRHVDLVFSSLDGLQVIAGDEPLDSAAQKVLECGPEMIVMSEGERGARLYAPGVRLFAHAYDVPVADTTGAGDCFHAAFIYCLLQNENLAYCLQFACAAAALAIQHVGAREGLPTADQVRLFMSTHNPKGEVK